MRAVLTALPVVAHFTAALAQRELHLHAVRMT